MRHLITLGIALLLLTDLQGGSLQKSRKAIAPATTFPDTLKLQPTIFYRLRQDGKPGREILLKFRGQKFSGKGSIEVTCLGNTEVIPLEVKEGIDNYRVFLPSGAGVKSNCEAKVTLKAAGRELSETVNVPAMKYWTVYIYPHSHVDIGYTNTHANVELIHKRNLVNGIDLAVKTAGYPDGARFLWNPEVMWPVERYLRNATPQEKQTVIDAVKKGYLKLDAGYVHTNTSTSADEELFEFFRESKEVEKMTGQKVETLVQIDVPGMSWGIVPVAAKLGIKYCFAFNNGSDRVGWSMKESFRPFWWLGPDGKSKILFLQPGSYVPGAKAKGYDYWPKMAGQTDPEKLIQIVKTDHPRDHFIDSYLQEQLPVLEQASYYPFDIFAMSWSMADNTPVDADLPEAVKSWNEDYAYPHLIIAGATDIMKTFEQKYGDQLPVLSGDFTEYWTDGLGTAAKQTGMNRSSRERLIQGETLWSMLHPGEAAPRKEIQEAWRNVIMGTEHTWCFMDPSRQPITNDILKVKFGFFEDAEKTSKSLIERALPSEQGSSVVGVFNTLSWPRGGLVHVPAEQSKPYGRVVDDKGKPVLSQRLSNGELVFLAADVPALGSRNYFLKPGEKKAKITIASANTLDNGIVKVVVDPVTGDISSLVADGQEYAGGSINSYNYLLGDKKATFPAQLTEEVNNLNFKNSIPATGPSDVKISVKENGPLVASILVSSDAPGCSSLTREITLVAGQRFVEINNIVDKKPVLEKEGIHFGFGFNIPAPVTRMDIPWGIAQLEKDQLRGGNRNWIAFQRWLDISNDQRGITWCSLDAPVFESGNMTANVMGGANNSPMWIRKLQPSSLVYSWALNNHWYTNFPLSQEGKIQFRYRVMVHNKGYDATAANHFGMEQSQPLLSGVVKKDFSLSSPVSVTGDPSVNVSVLKTVDDGSAMIVRLRSVSATDQKVTVGFNGRKPASVRICDFYEEAGPKLVNDGVVTVPAMGLVTLKAEWK